MKANPSARSLCTEGLLITGVSRSRCFGGTQAVYSHEARETACVMRFGVFLPPQSQAHAVPVLYWLSGLTCTEENFIVKAGAQRVAAELGLAIVVPDTSPRGLKIPGEDASYDFGVGAGFYVDATQAPWSRGYRMYSYVTKELSRLVESTFPVDPARTGIFGHSMGGHGALTIALKNPAYYKSVSAFAPICSAMRSPWGEKALTGYLGADRALWRDYDASALIESRGWQGPALLVDQGTSDQFLESQLKPELLKDGKNTENVTTFGMGYDLKMWSPLGQINRSNIKRLVPIWNFGLMNDMGELSQPTIYNGVMYVVNGNWTFAIDVATGRQIWRTPVTYERAALRVTTSGAYIRGAATIYNGKLFRQSIDAHVMALDMKTGKEIWKQKFAEWKESYAGIVAPTIANGVLISGMAGGDRTARGFIEGYDPDTGKQLWRRWTVPAPGEPGSETWPGKEFPDAWKYGGAATWQPGSYDPQLDLFYVGTGNAEPYNPKYRGGLDSLYAASLLAIRPKTGELVWDYQFLPNDSFDFDGTAESILADIQVGGQPRKA